MEGYYYGILDVYYAIMKTEDTATAAPTVDLAMTAVSMASGVLAMTAAKLPRRRIRWHCAATRLR